MIVDGEHDMVGDEADYWIMLKAQRERSCVNVYWRGQFIYVGWRKEPDTRLPSNKPASLSEGK